MRLRSEGYDVVTQEVLRRATRPESLKLTAQEEDLGQRLDSINGTLSDPEAVRAWQDAKMKKWLERVEVEVERDRPRVTATVSKASALLVSSLELGQARKRLIFSSSLFPSAHTGGCKPTSSESFRSLIDPSSLTLTLLD